LHNVCAYQPCHALHASLAIARTRAHRITQLIQNCQLKNSAPLRFRSANFGSSTHIIRHFEKPLYIF